MSFFKKLLPTPPVSKLSFEDAEPYRITTGELKSAEGERNGFFAVKIDNLLMAMVIVTDGEQTGWERVSVHIRQYRKDGKIFTSRLPTFLEMEMIKQLFFAPDAVVMQLHLPGAPLNNKVLTLWRPVRETIPTPPEIFEEVNQAPETPNPNLN